LPALREVVTERAYHAGMMSTNAVVESLDRSFGLYRDLFPLLDETLLSSRLGSLPSNTVGAQLWCVVGARESYARAIVAGEWAGFSCSLEATTDPASVCAALDRSAGSASEAVRSLDRPSHAQERLVLDLLEHEAQHHGQLIRYLYGLRHAVPASWKERYGLD
jgi:hypothetical protein